MKVFISVDMEGISGPVRWADVAASGQDYPRNREVLTADANAAIAGAFAGGAEEVVVEENHGVEDLTNLRMDQIDPRARVIRGAGRQTATTMAGLDAETGVVLLIGHHARAGVDRDRHVRVARERGTDLLDRLGRRDRIVRAEVEPQRTRRVGGAVEEVLHAAAVPGDDPVEPPLSAEAEHEGPAEADAEADDATVAALARPVERGREIRDAAAEVEALEASDRARVLVVGDHAAADAPERVGHRDERTVRERRCAIRSGAGPKIEGTTSSAGQRPGSSGAIARVGIAPPSTSISTDSERAPIPRA